MNDVIKPLNQIITPQSLVEEQIVDLLRKAKSMLGPNYCVTFIARNPVKDNSDLMASEEADLDQLIAAINVIKTYKRRAHK
jgi:hypothetical protein